MITGIAHLFEKTKEDIAKLRDIKFTGFADNQDVSRVYNRAAQICALDYLLAEHRLKYGNHFDTLDGVRALHHKLLLKYSWPLPLIKELSLSDALLALNDELQFDSFPKNIGEYFHQVTKGHYKVNFSDYLEGEWNPGMSSRFLTEIQ